jgi:selenocysteine lyase/cysteine desulfurase
MDADKIRAEFPITRNFNFQDNAGVAPLSRRAAQAMRRYVDQAEQNAAIEGEWYKHADHVRQLAAALLNASAQEITFVKNTSEGLCLVANGLKWNTGDNIVTAAVEFPANVYPWMNLAASGVHLKMIPEDNGQVPTEKIIQAIDSRTRLVTLSAVQYASGCRMDLEAIGRACQDKGTLLCVDAIQALGVLPIDVRAMHIDFLSADGHKWLCGPEGAGIFFCRRELLEYLRPSEPGWMCMANAEAYGKYQFEFRRDARRFDSGSYNIAGIYGLGASLELLLEIGLEPITRHVLALTDRLAAGLRDKGYRVVSPRLNGQASGIVAFTSDVHDHHHVQQHLQAEHRVVIAVREGRLRASPHVYTSLEEIDQLLRLLPAH